ncbi:MULTISPECIES: ScbR family autoregulator-binding transcription factor [Streptomyces]|uniref:ScbR family autoregulator-binding transcription factor n=1 Tax=Streptomyces TaxID=1883 RepID=UPI00067BBBB9|nr:MULTISPECIES: ScbR family autoregulator-binding transcription factor [Streptomyces]MDX2919834.1 ScbR family autoregulator-binding transcription factor [Streptomyces sp. NE06-03C]MDX3608863.1 ScbR family autoregulator-binding transcription factor [Streptomyces sp. FL06-04B]MDX3739102.1 ScbR family autoregulator-binding transcription factor [Streptomyces sp. ID01-15D]
MAQQERARKTKDAILEAAGAVFAERGYDGATVSDVYSRAGLTKGAFYFHFSSKKDLAEEVLSIQVDRQGYPILPRQVKLQELVDAGFVFAHRLMHDSMLQGSVNLSLESGAHQLDRKRPFVAWIDHNQRALTEANDHGELYSHVDTAEVAELMVSSFSGAQILSHILTGRRDLTVRVAALLAHLLPTIAVPAVLARLDIATDRGERVLAEAGVGTKALRPAPPGLTETL